MDKLHIAFFPFMTPGHSIPMLDLVRLFLARGVKTTVLTTPLNAPNIAKYLNHHHSNIYITPFPTKDAGLPQGVESQDHTTTPEMTLKFFVAMELLKHPLELFLQETKPNCLIADNFFPYATDIASKFGIPRLVFHFTGSFAMSVMMALSQYQPQNSVSSDDEPFIVPNLPHQIELTKSQLQQSYESSNDDINNSVERLFRGAGRALFASYGVIFNSFYDLEPDYVNYYKNNTGKHFRVWHVGPVSLRNRHVEGKSKRGQCATISEHSCLEWLDARESNSVIYVCFGSLTCFSTNQLKEIAIALEKSGLNFIWVVKSDQNNEAWLPQGFEERIEGKGLVIRGWAPQVLILDHKAIGGLHTREHFSRSTHGYMANLFYNEKLVTDVLKIGVKVGSMHWSQTTGGTFLDHEKIGAALEKVMVGEGGLNMREKAKKLKVMAYKAVEKSGSSYCQMSSMIDELICRRVALTISFRVCVLSGQYII